MRAKPSPLPNASRTAPTAWVRSVAAVVRAIPRGAVLSYAEVALRAGKPGAARAVVRALGRCGDVPWWRVVRSDLTVAAEMYSSQAPRLKREGLRLAGRQILSRPAPQRR